MYNGSTDKLAFRQSRNLHQLQEIATMATKEVTLLRSFAFQDSDEKQHYFTRDNQDTILEIVGEGNLQPYIDNGLIEVYDGTEVVPKTAATPAPRTIPGVRPSNPTTAAARPASRKEV